MLKKVSLAGASALALVATSAEPPITNSLPVRANLLGAQSL